MSTRGVPASPASTYAIPCSPVPSPDLRWANRTLKTGVIGNDQTEFNRLLRNRYIDGDFRCNRPECLAPDPRLFVPLRARFHCAEGAEAGAEAANTPIRSDASEGHSNGSGCGACGWRALPSVFDSYTGLRAVAARTEQRSWDLCEGRQLHVHRRSPVLPTRRVYWMWGGRVRFGVLPVDRFLQGATYFVHRLHEQRGVAPLHVHVTYTMGADYGKRSRLRAAGLWHEAPPPADGSKPTGGGGASSSASSGGQGGAAAGSAVGAGARVATSGARRFEAPGWLQARPMSFVKVSGLEALLRSLLDAMHLPPSVWACDAPPTAEQEAKGHLPDRPSAFFVEAGGRLAGRCYHPGRLVPRGPPADFDFEHAPDPASPHVAVQFLSRLVLRNAFALAYALGRALVLPRLWALCERHWWQLVDCRLPGNPLPMPYEAPYDLLFSLEHWQKMDAVPTAEAAAVRGLGSTRLHVRAHEKAGGARSTAAAKGGEVGGDGGGDGGGGDGGGDGGGGESATGLTGHPANDVMPVALPRRGELAPDAA